MKKNQMYSLMAAVAFTVALAGCGQKNSGKITDIPVTSQSADAKASVAQGLAFADQGDLQKAKACYVKAIEQDPKLAIAYVLKAGTNESPKEVADDMTSAKTNLEGASDYEKLYYDLNATFMSNDYNKRLEVAQKIATTYPDAARAQVDLGGTYWGGNDPVKARECFKKAVQMNPKWTGGYNSLTTSYLFGEPKDFKADEENAMKVVELAPTSPGAQIILGDCYRAQTNLEKARDAYSKAITLDPNVSEGYYKKGNANTFVGNYDEARKNYMDGATHDETKLGAIQMVAYTYLYGGDSKTAMTWLSDQMSKLDASGEAPSKILAAKMNCLDNAANIALHTGDVAKLKELETAMGPVSTQVANDLGVEQAKINQKATMLYWEAIATAMEGNFDAAKAKAEEIKTTVEPINDPNKLNSYEFAMGYISMKQKNYADAIGHFEKTQPDNSVYNKYWLAMANQAAGNNDKAQGLFKQIANYNFNEVGYALIRNEVKSKMTPNTP